MFCESLTFMCSFHNQILYLVYGYRLLKVVILPRLWMLKYICKNRNWWKVIYLNSGINTHDYKYPLFIALMASIFMNSETGWIFIVLFYATDLKNDCNHAICKVDFISFYKTQYYTVLLNKFSFFKPLSLSLTSLKFHLL